LATLTGQLNRTNTTISLLAGLLGLAISVSHLGRPLKAWRAFLGLKTSWLSREIIMFGAFAPCAILLTLSFWLPGLALLRLQQLMAVSVLLTGMSGVVCSVMVYHDTRRKFWRWPVATEKFLGTTIILGAAPLNLPIVLATTAALKFICEFWSAASKRRFHFSESSELERSRHLLTHDLRTPYILQLATLALGAALSFTSPILAFTFLLLSELLERHLFFVAVSPDRMPGTPK
jgi:DMSO reductase anchor subunit